MGEQTNMLEVIWGHRLLDEGFTAIPNIIIRNYRQLKIEHGEWGFICTLLTYKHDQRDPYPSQETIAEHMQVSVRQIKKWSESLVSKNLLLVGQRRHTKNRQFGSAVYNFKPLIDAALKLVGEEPLPESDSDWDVEYRNPSVPEVHPEPSEPRVPSDGTPEVHPDPVPQVHTKRSLKKTNNENNNNTVAAVQNEIESRLGVSIRSLSNILPSWIKRYGSEQLLELASYIGSTPEKWGNIVGIYRTAVTEVWDIQNEIAVAQAPVKPKERVRDERYAAFYELYPDS